MKAPIYALVPLISVIQAVVADSGLFNITHPGQTVLGNFADSCFPNPTGPLPVPKKKPDGKTPAQWWCSPTTENGFLGFTYETEGCQDAATLTKDFTRMRTEFKARYVRMYGWCDQWDYFDRFVAAAYAAGLGVHATIWFGFDGGNQWQGRRDKILNFVRNTDWASYAIRTVDVGSEPLFDWVLTPPQKLADEIKSVKKVLNPYGINVSISEMQYGYTVQGDSQMVLDVEDVVHAHQLPFFDKDAKDGSKAQPSVVSSTNWFVQHTKGTRKIIYSQTGWPTNAKVWKPNSPKANASVESAQAYAQILDQSCESLKKITPQGGVGWFWHIYKDSMLDGWGVLDWNEKPKWNFRPRIAC
ncbi:hypothetical protein CPB86DRAFT_790743 [Serendipita vermifera]|nr:hypothetical protein CPB86DRAFT_790743 [Serendipita vermifera]